MSDDVAGATFLAAAGSAPELFSNIVDTFFTQNSIGVGTIIGSAMFNILVIIAASGVFAAKPLLIDWRPLLRDIFFYLCSIGGIMAFFGGIGVEWWESGCLLLIYFFYILFMKYNARILRSLCPRPDWDSPGDQSVDASEFVVTESQAEDGVLLDTSRTRAATTGGNVRNKFRAAAVLTHLLPTRVVVNQYHAQNVEVVDNLNSFLRQRRGVVLGAPTDFTCSVYVVIS